VPARLPSDAVLSRRIPDRQRLSANHGCPCEACIVDRYVTDAVDARSDHRHEAVANVATAAREKGRRVSFSCPAPAELPSRPFPLSAVRRAHVIVDVVFSDAGALEATRRFV
jgi:hypothetical protein